MAKKSLVHGFSVIFEDNAQGGIEYLRNDLDSNEARVFFDQAKTKGSAKFEDDEDRQFTLIYQVGSSTFTLVRR